MYVWCLLIFFCHLHILNSEFFCFSFNFTNIYQLMHDQTVNVVLIRPQKDPVHKRWYFFLLVFIEKYLFFFRLVTLVIKGKLRLVFCAIKEYKIHQYRKVTCQKYPTDDRTVALPQRKSFIYHFAFKRVGLGLTAIEAFLIYFVVPSWRQKYEGMAFPLR